ncbi:MAG TPA: single-stranded-DNA-specific exonuclease RecJ [Candidatus Sutterella merdavium]|nr:single-stranded-DNA-specific exonuclease RecJ [Candidatus Sutterella merdavium]
MTTFVTRPYDPTAANVLTTAGYLPPVARALSARGIRSPEDLNEAWSGMLPPNLLTGIDRAAERLLAARNRGEHVTIVADYDCDGATACAVGIRGLSALGLSVDYFVPDRVRHGYGLTAAIVDLLAARPNPPQVILTVDNGISSADAVRHAATLGIDVVITDHHLPADDTPPAVAIVNPNQRGCGFPSKSLAGVGVIFYVLLALRARLRDEGAFTAQTQPRLNELVDLVALGTVADVVKLDKNNRILVSQGLKRIREGRTHPGIAALFNVARCSMGNASARDFGFRIGPRINAAGRLATMEYGIECLLTDDPDRARHYAEALNQINQERRELEEEMQHAADLAVAAADIEHVHALSLLDDSFSEGVVGLVASRIKEKVHRPTVAFARTADGELKGSGRSIPGIHLRDMLDLVSKTEPGLILRFGGHAMAAGLTIQEKDYDRFARAFEAVVAEHADPAVFERNVLIDGGLAPDEISELLCQTLEHGIWGQGFEAPLFANDFRVVRQTVLKDAHLKLSLELGGQRFEGIFFRRNAPLLTASRLAYRPTINEFNGRRLIQLLVEAVES